jgi:MFS family permease
MISIWKETPLLALCMGNFILTCSNAVFAPYYSVDAIAHGVSLNMVAMFFTLYPISKIIFNLILGKNSGIIGRKACFIIGLSLQAVCVIAIGACHFI